MAHETSENCLIVLYPTCTVMIAMKYPYEERVHANHSKQLVYHRRVLRAATERVRARFERVSSAIILSPKFHAINALRGAFMRKIWPRGFSVKTQFVVAWLDRKYFSVDSVVSRLSFDLLKNHALIKVSNWHFKSFVFLTTRTKGVAD